MDLLDTVRSEQGVTQVEQTLLADDYLGTPSSTGGGRGPASSTGRYFLALYGEPSADGPVPAVPGLLVGRDVHRTAQRPQLTPASTQVTWRVLGDSVPIIAPVPITPTEGHRR